MKSRVAWLACLLLIVVGIVVSGYSSLPPASPVEVQITPPKADVPPDVAAFSGVWEGEWNSRVPALLIIEQVRPTWATVLHFSSSHPDGQVYDRRERVKARVLPGGKLQWGVPGRVVLEIAANGTTLQGKRDRVGREDTITLLKTSAQITSRRISP